MTRRESLCPRHRHPTKSSTRSAATVRGLQPAVRQQPRLQKQQRWAESEACRQVFLAQRQHRRLAASPKHRELRANCHLLDQQAKPPKFMPTPQLLMRMMMMAACLPLSQVCLLPGHNDSSRSILLLHPNSQLNTLSSHSLEALASYLLCKRDPCLHQTYQEM